MIRYIELTVTPTVWARENKTNLHTVEIKVRTAKEAIALREVVPDSEFITRFEWMMKRITREVIERSAETEPPVP